MPIEDTRRILGKELHTWLQQTLHERGYQVESEIDLSEGLPKGWRGAADLLLTARSDGATWLVDLKTVSAIQLYMTDQQASRVPQQSNKDNSWPSEEHTWQLSAYYWALKKMGKKVDRAALLYWPVDTYYDRSGRKHTFSPRAVEIQPIGQEQISKRMEKVSQEISEWRQAWEKTGQAVNFNLPEHLEPEQKLIPKPSARNADRYEVHQKLDWRCRYCPFFQVSCDPPWTDEHIGTYYWEEGRWVYHPEIPGTKPLVKP